MSWRAASRAARSSAAAAEYVEINGFAYQTAVSAGTEVVYGHATSVTIASGGDQNDAGDTYFSVVSSGGVEQILGSATAFNTTLELGGADYVESGGVALNTLVSGGADYVEAGGSAGFATVDGGAQFVYGLALSTTVASGGVQYVYAGGIASTTAVFSGGDEYVMSGGTISGASISGGTIELTSGAVDGAAAITFATSGGGILRLDDFVHFGGLVAGFGLPDELDLADIGLAPRPASAFSKRGPTPAARSPSPTASIPPTSPCSANMSPPSSPREATATAAR